MRYVIRLLLMASPFLVPSTQAIISAKPASTEQSTGYQCQNGGKTAKVSIHYTDTPNNLPCKVILEKSNQGAIPLLEARRNTAICEEKAEVMKQRLIDRGWYCHSFTP